MSTSGRPPGGPLAPLLKATRDRWSGLALRERRALTLAAWALGLGLLWAFGLQQPLQKGRQAQARLAQLEEQELAMQRQAAEAQALKSVTALPAGQADQALQAATERLGARGRLQRQGDRAVLSVDGVNAAELQAWWVQSRAGARARVLEMQMSRSDRGLTGTLTVTLGESP